MRTLLQAFPLVLIVLGVIPLFERRAYAYADPGSGLLFVQALGSAPVACGWSLRRKIYTFYHRGIAARQNPEEYPAAKEDEGSSLQ